MAPLAEANSGVNTSSGMPSMVYTRPEYISTLAHMGVVLFFRKGIMGDKELPDLLKKRQKKATKEAVQP